ncbi:MAG: PAS domain S-box protein [Chloroflexi bacterium]|nr:PAS domain S-box protein [Chloroflexota bacterium]
MSWQTFPYLIPYIASFIISMIVGLLTFQRRKVAGAGAYAWVVFSQALWTFGYVFELVSPDLENKIFWDDFQWLGAVGYYFGFLAFSLTFTGGMLQNPKRTWGLLSIMPAALLLLITTNDLHGLYRGDSRLITGEPFSALDYDFTPAVLIFSIYVYLLILASLYILIKHYFRSKPNKKSQTGVIIVGTIIPIVGTMLTLAGVTLTFQRDTTPLTFAISALVVGFGLFRFRLFDLLPIARDTLVATLADSVVVLDNQNRIIDINSAAVENTGWSTSQAIGRNASEVFSAFPNLLAQFQGDDEIHTEFSLEMEGIDGLSYFDFSIIPLRNPQGQNEGSLVITRNITERKEAERILKNAKEELERRVEERTAELHLSEKKYRQVVENAHEGITVIQNGKFKFSNPKALEISGYSPEELASTTFLEIAHLDDHDVLVDRNRKRLKGEKISEDFTFRMIHKDETIRWVETRAELISWDGKPAMLAFFNDVTDRKDAQEQILLQTQALDAAANGIIITDREGTILWVNPAFTTMTGYSFKEAVGQKPSLIKSDSNDPALYKDLWKTITSEKV